MLRSNKFALEYLWKEPNEYRENKFEAHTAEKKAVKHDSTEKLGVSLYSTENS